MSIYAIRYARQCLMEDDPGKGSPLERDLGHLAASLATHLAHEIGSEPLFILQQLEEAES